MGKKEKLGGNRKQQEKRKTIARWIDFIRNAISMSGQERSRAAENSILQTPIIHGVPGINADPMACNKHI